MVWLMNNKIVFVFVFVALCGMVSAQDSWWNQNFSYRAELSNLSNNISYFEINKILNINPGFEDLRFISNDTELNFSLDYKIGNGLNYDNVTRDGLVAYYKMDRMYGNIALDIHGGNNGTVNNGVSANGDGKINDSYSFDGNNSYLDMGDNSNFDFGNGSFTISAWIKYSNSVDNPPIIGKGNPGFYVGDLYNLDRYNHYSLYISSNGAHEGSACFYLRSNLSQMSGICGDTSLDDNFWHLIVATRDAESQKIKIYIDGIMDGNANNSVYGSVNSSWPLRIGRYPVDYQLDSVTWIPVNYSFFNGSIDEVSIWNRLLNDTEIYNLFNEQSAKFRVDNLEQDSVYMYYGNDLADSTSNSWQYFGDLINYQLIDVIIGSEVSFSLWDSMQPIFPFKDIFGNVVAAFLKGGGLLLNGTCTSSTNCIAPNNSMIFQNSVGQTTAYIDINGNLCLEGNLNCSNFNQTSCNPAEDALLIQYSIKNNVSYVDFDGNLCLTGGLFENA